ncbi:MAG: methylenetetrahydrofolate reductase [NAD(P)H] [Gammaproteobacteria bacterium]|nr:methylenetetrahydrofolate reductase [NAD(P)H] [Gammaproteobacteria bacterium]
MMISQWNANPTAYLDRPVREGPLSVSVEMFPPGTESGWRGFRRSLEQLSLLGPEFVSVTSGAGGGGSRKTLETIVKAKDGCDISFAAHLTSIGKSRQEVHGELDAAMGSGIRHVVALRGDLPRGRARHPEGYQSALELVRAMRSREEYENCSISVAAYPEGHPEAVSQEEETGYLRRKVDAGANRIITQFFFDTEVFAVFMERIRSAGIDVPVLPGILPIVDFPKAVAFANKCQTRIPRWYHVMYRDLEQSVELHQAISVSIAVEQCRQLMALGVRDFHFYTLNRSELTVEVCRELGISPERPRASVEPGRSRPVKRIGQAASIAS